MNHFNPYMPSPIQDGGPRYGGAAMSYSYGDAPLYQPGYTPLEEDVWGPDAWMRPDYPTTPARPAPFNPYMPLGPPSPHRVPNPNVDSCALQHVARISGGAVAGAYVGGQRGAQHCPSGPYYGPCVGVSAATGMAFGAFEGYASARDSASCQDVVHRGPTVIHYGQDMGHGPTIYPEQGYQQP